jgi:Tol biopolymer transport system component
MSIRFLSRPLAAPAALALALALAGCEGGPTDLDRPLSLQVQGRLERGHVVSVVVSAEGAPVPDAQITLSPAGAGELLGGGQVRLLRAGPLTIEARAPNRVGTTTVTVAAPPVIFFDKLDGGNRDIWRVDLDGQNLTRLTTDLGDDQDPTVARDRVVFVSYRAGNAELFSMPLTGGETRLTTTTANETTPSLSPDGARLAYAFDISGVTKLWTAAGNGTGAARATEGFGFSGSIEVSPSWAATGNRLVFVATNTGSADLYDFPIPGSPAPVAGSTAAEVEPAYSADGQRIAFASNRPGSNGTDVWMVRLSGGEVTRLTTDAGSEVQPAWTPDGRLVYVAAGRLRWLDPADASAGGPIETGAGTVQRPAVLPN